MLWMNLVVEPLRQKGTNFKSTGAMMCQGVYSNLVHDLHIFLHRLVMCRGLFKLSLLT